jgi:hypothetical protein
MNKKGVVVGRELHVLERRVLMDAMEACDDGGVAHGQQEKGRHGISGVYIVDKRGERKKK